jgi:hypothetical protein
VSVAADSVLFGRGAMKASGLNGKLTAMKLLLLSFIDCNKTILFSDIKSTSVYPIGLLEKSPYCVPRVFCLEKINKLR